MVRLGNPPPIAQDLETVEVLSETVTMTEVHSQQPVLDEEDWDDEPTINLARPNERSPSPISSTLNGSTTTRKRKHTKGQPSQERSIQRRGLGKNLDENTPPLVDIDREKVKRAAVSGIAHSLAYVWDIISTTLRWLKKPIAMFATAWLFAQLLFYAASSFRSAFAPLCWLPIVSRSALCGPITHISRHVDYPKLMDLETSSFEQILEQSAGSTALSLELKQAHMFANDLAAMVRVSELKSRDTLARVLDEFGQDAKKTSRGLSKLGTKVTGAIDSITAVNDYALRTIEAEVKKGDSAIAYFLPIIYGGKTKEVIAKTFEDAMVVLSTHMRRIMVEAEVNLQNLNGLEERLNAVHEMLSREKHDLGEAKSDLLEEVWTRVGGNKKHLRKMEHHMSLLRDVGEYRTQALAQVIGTLQTLQQMGDDMEDLRERVTAPELLGDRVPAEVHMKSIKVALDRLVSGQRKSLQNEAENAKGILGGDHSEL